MKTLDGPQSGIANPAQINNLPHIGPASLWAVWVILGAQVCYGVDFQKDVKPILSNHCYQCHGPDAPNRKAGLRLDTKAGVLSTIVPGDPSASLMMKRAANPKVALRMPPPYAHKDLTPENVKTLEQWIASGAEWKEHWAFIAPERPTIPPVSKPEWVRNPIDAFVLARLDKEGLTPAGPEDRARLIRRVSLDLTGLPPSPEEVASFVKDRRPDAYERVVDHYLGSKSWGEHRARYWLDAARYGDTHGLHADNYREIWPFRDWVIQAFNKNMPFDQFTIDQMAGDLLDSPTIDQQIATGFHRCNVTTNEGGVIPEEVQVMYVKDRVDTTSTVWLGLTLGCATCHDHKFDPLTQKDLYRMAAFFNNTTQPPLDGNIPEPEPVVMIPKDADRARLAQLEPRFQDLQSQFEATTKGIKVDEAWKPELEWSREAVQATGANAGTPLQWKAPFTLQVLFSKVDVPRAVLASYTDSTLHLELALESMFPVVRIDNRLTKTRVAVRGNSARISPGMKQEITVTYDGSGTPEGVTISVAGRSIPLGRVDPIVPEAAANGWVVDPKFTLSAILYPRRLPAEEVLVAAKMPEEQSQVVLHMLRTDQAFQGLFRELETLEAERRKIRMRGNVTLVMKEKQDSQPRARVLNRGQYDQPGEEVSADTPGVLPPMTEGQPKNRLGLAKWIVDERNPLTARVTVNRFWQEVFGTGLVKSSEDFGATGQPPVHPELLDWLAVEFRESGWDVKKLFRLMLTSSTYRQSAVAGVDRMQRDPENRLLARGPRFRMDGEMIRDLALATSGTLVNHIGGPSVKPYQPTGVWEAVAVLFSNTRFYQQGYGDDLHRRSLYTFWKRSAPPASLDILNAPSRESCVVRRERTNTPLQSLVTLNDPQFFEAAQNLAARAQDSSLQANARVDYMTSRILSRRLAPVEMAFVRNTYQKLNDYFAGHRDEAQKIAPKAGQPADSAAWVMIASQLLNLDEALNK
jgi:hypothetical protein